MATKKPKPAPIEAAAPPPATEAPDHAVEINRLRNVIQAACTGGIEHMIERWKTLFPDAPVPTVKAAPPPPTEPAFEIVQTKEPAEILRVTPEGEFLWHADADALIGAQGDTAATHILRALRRKPALAELLPGWSFRRFPGGWVGCIRPDGEAVNVLPGDKTNHHTLYLLLGALLEVQERP